MASRPTFIHSPAGENALEKALARVAELEAELKVSQQGSEIANQDLQHFCYAASHDLQAPLRAIKTYSELLERFYPDDDRAKDCVEFITAGVDEMYLLIQTLLLFSRVTRTPALTTVNPKAAVHAAMFKLSKEIAACGAVVKFDGLPEVTANEAQLSQVFEQVLANSLRYRGSRTPEVQFAASECLIDGNNVQLLSISDNGSGIEAEYIDQVKVPFKRLHGREYKGTGLGLAICEKIMRAHQGKIWLESDGSSGTTVHLAFPF